MAQAPTPIGVMFRSLLPSCFVCMCCLHWYCDAAPKNGFPGGFNNFFVVTAISRCSEDGFAVDGVEFGGRILGIPHPDHRAHQLLDGAEAITDRRQARAAQVDILKVVGAGFGVTSVDVLQAAVLIGVADRKSVV